jgi:hypothetical protein
MPASATFNWTTVAGADQYWLDVGSTLAHGDLAAVATANTSASVTGIPCDGRTIYVQLFTHTNGAWLTPQRYTYTACTATVAQITSPAPQTTLSTSATFNWSTAAGADQYWLDVGSTLAHGDLFATAVAATSQVVTGLPCDGRTLYVQLFTHSGGAWLTPQRYTYTAPTGCGATIALMISPTPQTTLSTNSATFTWNAVTNADQYWLDIGTVLASGNLSAGATASTSKTVGGLPCDGSTLYVQLYTHTGGVWLAPQRYTYTAAALCTP